LSQFLFFQILLEESDHLFLVTTHFAQLFIFFFNLIENFNLRIWWWCRCRWGLYFLRQQFLYNLCII
jgi:hypothetical protein